VCVCVCVCVCVYVYIYIYRVNALTPFLQIEASRGGRSQARVAQGCRHLDGHAAAATTSAARGWRVQF